MIPWRKNILILANTVILFVVLLITLSNSSFTCEIKNGAFDETCAANRFPENETEMCQGTVFLISAQAGNKSILILCPWSTATVTVTILGFVVVLLYTVVVILRAIKPLSQKINLLISFIAFPLVLASTVLMLTGISDGGKKCEEFEADLEGFGSQGNCSNAAYGIDFILSMIGMLMFGYESVQGYFAYKYGENDYFYDYKDNDVFTQARSDKGEDLKTFYFPYDDD